MQYDNESRPVGIPLERVGGGKFFFLECEIAKVRCYSTVVRIMSTE